MRRHANDGRWQLLDQRAVVRLGSSQRFFGSFAGCDIEEQNLPVERLPLRVEQHLGLVPDPDERPVLAEESVFDIERLGSFLRSEHGCEDALAILRVHLARPGAGNEPLLRRETGQLLDPRTDVVEGVPARPVRQQLGRGRADEERARQLLDERTVACLRLAQRQLGLLPLRDVHEQHLALGRPPLGIGDDACQVPDPDDPPILSDVPVFQIERCTAPLRLVHGSENPLAVVRVELTRPASWFQPFGRREAGQAFDGWTHVLDAQASVRFGGEPGTDDHRTGELLDQRAVALLRFAERQFDLLALGDIGEQDLPVERCPVGCTDDVRDAPHPDDRAVLAEEAELDRNRRTGPIGREDRRQHSLPVVRVELGEEALVVPLLDREPGEPLDRWTDVRVRRCRLERCRLR